jgi:NAD(P)H dehydrogenase (quinone)
MTTDGLLAVTGATGALGGRVARRLASGGAQLRLIVRDAARAPDLAGAHVAQAEFGDAEAMREALRDVTTLLLISASEAADRVRLHTTAIDAAVAAGVGRIVYVSFLNAAASATFTFARDHWHTEEHIRRAGVAHTFLRDSLYQDVFPYFVGPDGVLRGPAGDGRVGAVARDDIADAAVGVLLGAGRTSIHDGRSYDLTGPRAMTLYEIADDMSRASGRDITYHPETMEEAYASRSGYGAPDWEVAGWVTSYAAIATGEMDVMTDAVEQLSGHPPQSFDEFLEANPDAVARLRRLR